MAKGNGQQGRWTSELPAGHPLEAKHETAAQNSEAHLAHSAKKLDPVKKSRLCANRSEDALPNRFLPLQQLRKHDNSKQTIWVSENSHTI